MSEDVRGEAARLRHRLEVARDRLGAVLTAGASGTGGLRGPGGHEGPGGHGEPGGHVGHGGVGATAGAARIDDDDEVRHLLRPAADRIARLLELTSSLADGTLSEASAETAVRAVADAQPFRSPR